MAKQPRQRKPRLKKINLSAKDKWKSILKEVDKDEIPLEVLERIIVNLIDGTAVEIEIRTLLKEGYDPKEIEKSLNTKLEELDDIINDVDFFVCLDAVANTVQPQTDHILKDLL